jgi:hypothetical protein
MATEPHRFAYQLISRHSTHHSALNLIAENPSCCIIRPITLMSTAISASPTQDAANIRLRRHILCTALWVAALANVLVPALWFSVTQFFGPTDPRYRALVAVVLVAEYAIAFLLILLHANVGFAAGYTAATAVTVTLGSAVLAYITLVPAPWSSSALSGEILVLAGFAFAVLSNFAFLVASIRYGRAIHPRLHLPGFFLGIAAYGGLIFAYVRLFR